MAEEPLIIVRVASQTAECAVGENVVWRAPVSTALNGLGETPGSDCTPRGLHRVVKKIGDGQPEGSIFKARQPTGKMWRGEKSEEDLILTRILWLTGEEPRNQSSFERHIYFHGTNVEDKIGQPVSHGCIRLRNADMLALFDLVNVGTPVDIREA
ncbi:MAG: L,D-transpeptidase [bacterium]